MKKRLLALLLAVMAICPLLVACGGSHYNYDSYKEYIILGDISKIEIKEQDIENSILGAYYDYFSDDISDGTIKSEELASGEVKYGDTVSIDYKGYLNGETEPFEGGSTYDDDGKAEGTTLEIGSGSYIDGFESGLIGHTVGETVSLYLTFPELYSNTEYAGKKVRFDVVINKITKRYAYPEMTDDKIKEISDGEFTTVAEFRADAREDAIKNLIWSEYYQLCRVKKWPEDELKDYYYNALDTYKQYASMFGTTFDTYATYMGYSDGDALRKALMSQAKQQCKQDLMVLAAVEEYGIGMSEKDLEKAMKAVWQEAKEENGYTDSYKQYLKDNEESAVRIAAYTETVMDYIKDKIAPIINNLGNNGIFGIGTSNVYYYVNGVKQTGWQSLDFDGDGVYDLYYFNPELDGRAYLNIAVKMTEENGSEEKYLKFDGSGKFTGAADKEIVFTKIGETGEGGYAYIENNTYKTGLLLLDRSGEIDGNEQYLFGRDGYMYLGVRQLNASDFDGIDFGDYEGKYYNFGTSGIFNFDLEEKKNGKYGASDNALANGLIDEKAYKDGDMVKGEIYNTGNDSNDTYYFDENGDMAKAKFVVVEGKMYYFDNGGKLIRGTATENHELQLDDIVYYIDENGEVVKATCKIDDKEYKSEAYTDEKGNVYYFNAEGEMVRNAVIDNVTVGDTAAKRYFDAYGKMAKSTTVELDGKRYTIDENGAITKTEDIQSGAEAEA